MKRLSVLVGAFALVAVLLSAFVAGGFGSSVAVTPVTSSERGDPHGASGSSPGIVDAGQPRERTTAPLLLVVVDSRGTPIVGARVAGQSGPVPGTTDVKGEIQLTHELVGRVVLVRASGFQPYLALVEPEVGTLRAQMLRAAALGVRVMSSSGMPLQGVRLELLPPLVVGEWTRANWRRLLAREEVERALHGVCLQTAEPTESEDEAWRRGVAELNTLLAPSPTLFRVTRSPLPLGGASGGLGELLGNVVLSAEATLQLADLARATDAEGYGLWDELAPGSYRVACSLAEWRDRDDARCANEAGLGSEDVSRPLLLHVDRRVDLLVEAPDRECTVRGGIATSGHEWSSVSVFDVTTVPGQSGGRDYESEVEESVCRPSADGRFEFRRVRPGRKRVRAKWRTGSDWSFAESEGRVDRGGCLDVGLMVPAAGPVVEVTVGLAAASGSDPQRALAELTKVGLSLRVASLADPRAGDVLRVVMDDWIPVRPGDRLRLLGVVAGRLDLALAWLGGKEVVVEGGRLTLPPERSLQIADRIAVQLDVGYARFAPARIELMWPSQESARATTVHVLREGKLLESRQLDRGVLDVQLPMGGLSILVESSRSSTGRDQGWFARLEDVRPPADGSPWRVTLTLQPGVVLAGAASAVYRRGLRSMQVFWMLDGVVPLRAPLDENGRFRLEGLPPGARLVGVRGTPDQWLPVSGMVEVELR